MTPYYDRDGITIYCGDCLEIMPQLDIVFDAIMADIPYGTTACNWDTIIPFEPLWENYERLVKGNGAVVLFGSQPFASLLVASNIEWFKCEWIWKKSNSGDFMTAKLKPRKHHENILVFSSGKEIYNPQMQMGKAYTDKPRKRTNNIANSTMPKLGIVNDGQRYPSSIQYFSNGNNNILHPTQKPVDLLAYLIRTYTNPGEIILDNTMGSGTTLVAAQREGRRAIGIEILEEYCAIAVDRLRQPSFFSIPDKPKDQPAEQLSLSLK